ncbi:hypothetical protein DFH08DRAFT_816305 [Mycena albidolilacea]|uniref:Uncharacterized protein n=1 Tax=Mycena albidolilacea TaxID=1033008 RepID=A0AAD7EJK0_9AGAR|nr:hypothetical protein DFH08DRAFT_816305 [Mycena albidolilacea]
MACSVWSTLYCAPTSLSCDCMLLTEAVKHSKDVKYWDYLDGRIAKICRQANNNPRKITKAFCHYLDKDQEKYGADNYTIDTTPGDQFQQEVDSLIAACRANLAAAATSTESTQDRAMTSHFGLSGWCIEQQNRRGKNISLSGNINRTSPASGRVADIADLQSQLIIMAEHHG